MDEKKQTELEELSDELDIILSVKDNVSDDEIGNLANKFTSLSEYDIREKISEVTHDNSYVEKFIEVEGFNRAEVEDKKCNFDAGMKDIDINDNAIEEGEGHEGVRDAENQEDNESGNENVENQHGIVKDDEAVEDGTAGDNVEFDVDNIPDVTFVSGDIKYGQLSIEWGWPQGIDKVLLCYKMDKFPSEPGDSSARHIVIDREDGFGKGDYTINKAVQGNYYFCIYALVEYGDQILYSAGQRRLVVNKLPDEIFYEIRIRKNLFGRFKSAEIVINTGSSREIDLPELVLVGRIGNMPVQKCDGEDLLSVDYQTLKKDEEVSLDLPIEKIKKNMYVKLFFADDSNSKLFRIVSPAKEKLYFK